MLVRGKRAGTILALCLLPLLFFFSFRSWDESLYNNVKDQAGQWAGNVWHPDANGTPSTSSTQSNAVTLPSSPEGLSIIPFQRKTGRPERHPEINPHREVYSLLTPNRQYFQIVFGDKSAINPNIIPHPQFPDTWIIVAQMHGTKVERSVFYAELVCNAQFSPDNTVLACTSPPMILPIAATFGNKCTGDLTFFNMNVGPHDGRIFYGPQYPFAIYGSNSKYTCFGMWMQDFRMLSDWGVEYYDLNTQYRKATEIQRPPPWGKIEKNWFIFFDMEDNAYAHYDIYPKRSFARLEPDGSIKGGQDLGKDSTPHEDKCMEKFMPWIDKEVSGSYESIHQATNSLAITLCKRGECTPDSTNTFVMTIFQIKFFYNFHAVYEPYVMLFGQSAPFAVHAISPNPIWITGRGMPGQPGLDPLKNPDHTEMIYVTSISWKSNKYQGFLDDVLFLAFGIEDSKPGAIDIKAEDLMKDLAYCKDV